MDELKVNRKGLKKTWESVPGLNQKQIERQLIGSTILNVYPLAGIDGDGTFYLSGFSIAYRRKNGKIMTLDIDTHLHNGERDGETGFSIKRGYIASEEEILT